MNPRWFVIRTESRAEHHAADTLEKDGFETFLPRLRSLTAGTGHSDSPLFPGYLFIKLDPGISGWPSFRRGHRILGFLNFAGDIPSVPNEFIACLDERLKTVNGEGGQWQRYQPGETVRVVSASIRGLAKVIEGGKNLNSKVKVLLDFMGRGVSAVVPRDNIWPIEYEPAVRTRVARRTRGKGRRIQIADPMEPVTA